MAVIGGVMLGLGCGGFVADLDGGAPGGAPWEEPEVSAPPAPLTRAPATAGEPEAVERVGAEQAASLRPSSSVDVVVFEGSGEEGSVVVQYSDWRCPHCYAQMEQLWPVLQERDVRLRFRSFPLAAPCNPMVSRAEPERCELAALALCAHAAGRFEEFVAKARETDAVEVWSADPALADCLADPDTPRRVTEAAITGQELGLQGTPTWFVHVDGVWYAPSRPEQVLALVERGL